MADIFPIYEVLVENVFGSVGLAIMGVAFAIILIMFITRVSRVFMIYWIIFYFIVMGTIYLGALGLVLGFTLSTIYFFIALIRSIFREG